MTEIEYPLPENSDVLFKESNKDFRQNAMINSGIKRFHLYSIGYKNASISLFEQLKGDAFNANTQVYPLIFLNRQFLELRLKELISGLNFSINHSYTSHNGHKLQSLWNEYKRIILTLENYVKPDDLTLKATEKLILEFHTIDPFSFSFRYPVDNSNERKPTLNITNIDLLNFMTIMKKLYNFFDIQSALVFNLIDLTDEFLAIMRAEYLSGANYNNNF